MAELITITRSEVDYQAGRKATPTELNRVRVAIVESAATYTAAAADTFATHLVIPAGSRIMGGVLASFGTGAATATTSIGIRDAITKVAVDATAIVNALATTTAATAWVHTGTKLINGQYYLMPQDVEIYGTFNTAAPTANQAFRFEILWVSP